MVVVSDATTLIVLEKRGRFDLLANLFHEVLIPISVFNEINHKGRSIKNFCKIPFHKVLVVLPNSVISYMILLS